MREWRDAGDIPHWPDATLALTDGGEVDRDGVLDENAAGHPSASTPCGSTG